ncbi:MAG: glycosyltransferase family 2 protein [Hyphomonadaceae bacterium]
MRHADDTAPAAVDVCVCTFRRPSLRRTLESLARQDGAPTFRVIVADNDDIASAEVLVNEARAATGLAIHYVHAPARNISIARNACLEAARAPLIAFIDDDEIAPPGWLAQLAAALGRDGADVVFGPVKAEYEAGAPSWAVKGDFHSFAPAVRADGQIDTGYSSNVMFRRAAAGAARFDPALGRSGGEDTVFFAQLHTRGARPGFAPHAVVYEPTAAARVSMTWLTRRAFRSGQSHARVLRQRGQGALTIAAPATAKALYCALATLLTVWSPVLMRRNLLRGALHVGVVAKALGAAEPALYGG